MTLTFSDSPVVSSTGGKRPRSVPEEVMHALEDSATRAVGKLHKGGEAAVAEMQSILRSATVKRAYRVSTKVHRDESGNVTGIQFSATHAPTTAEVATAVVSAATPAQ